MWNIFVHTQKWINQISYQESNLIDRPLPQNCKLPTLYWHHVVLHTVYLIQIHLVAIIMVPPVVVIVDGLY